MDNGIPVGICVSPEMVSRVARGYDFLELTVSGTLTPLQDDAAFAARAPILRALAPAVRAFNVFAPPALRLVGDSVDWEAVGVYVERALRRVAQMGGQVVVFGSGGARAVPEGFPRSRAWEQLVRVLQLCAEHASGHGITMAIEPLNRRECNIVNSYLEAVELAKAAQRPEVRALADIYHFVLEDEPLDDILAAPEWLAHVHLADTGRLYPGSGSYPLKRLFAILKEIGYQGKTSVECTWGSDMQGESAEALRFVRGLAS